MSVTEGHLLDGRISYRQSALGHRSGIEPVLLAASVPARPGELVLEAGTGAGAALLALAWRVPEIAGIGIEIDAGLAQLAATNFRRNGFNGLVVVNADLLQAPFDPARPAFHHVLANPPWHDAAGTASPDAGRALARRAPGSMLQGWVAALTLLLRPKGTISLILPGASLGKAFTALRAAQCGSTHVLPLWPRAGSPAKLVIIRSRKCARGPDRLLPGLILHVKEGGYTADAEEILRKGSALMM